VPRVAGRAPRTAEVLVALRKQVLAGQSVKVLACVEDQALRFRVRRAKEPSAASLDPLRCSSIWAVTLGLIHKGTSGIAGRRSYGRLPPITRGE
jgi:hypothetical protein